jgi:hypothetical protein
MAFTKEEVIDMLKNRVRGGCRRTTFVEKGNTYIERHCWDSQGNLTDHTMFKNNLIIGECKSFDELGRVSECYYWVHDGGPDADGQDHGHIDFMPLGLKREGYIYVEGKYYLTNKQVVLNLLKDRLCVDCEKYSRCGKRYTGKGFTLPTCEDWFDWKLITRPHL